MADALDVGSRVRALRLERGLTIEQLAADTGLSGGHLSKIERSLQLPTVGTLQTIAAALRVEVVDLVIDPAGSERHEVIAITGTLTAEELVDLAMFLSDDDGVPQKKRAGRGVPRRVSRRRPRKRRRKAAEADDVDETGS